MEDIRDHFKIGIKEEHEDGGATMEVVYDMSFRQSLRDIYSRQRLIPAHYPNSLKVILS